MPTITNIETLEGIKVGAGSRVDPDGTVRDPEPYSAANVHFDDGTIVQVERPLTPGKVAAAHAAAQRTMTVDGVSIGDVV